jgi:hypothetical protein
MVSCIPEICTGSCLNDPVSRFHLSYVVRFKQFMEFWVIGHLITPRMDGRGCVFDNIFIERASGEQLSTKR